MLIWLMIPPNEYKRVFTMLASFVSRQARSPATQADFRQNMVATPFLAKIPLFSRKTSVGWGKIKLEITTLPRIFIHAVLSIYLKIYSQSSASWRTLQFL